jgi:NAD(P)H-dependent flavin oxidoreductase YrpB (nitropropane dioxygenase family)
MWPNRRLIDLLKIEHPIVLSPMVGFGTIELAAAACAAGALGSIGCGPTSPEVAAKAIRQLRTRRLMPTRRLLWSRQPRQRSAGDLHQRCAPLVVDAPGCCSPRKPKIALLNAMGSCRNAKWLVLARISSRAPGIVAAI